MRGRSSARARAGAPRATRATVELNRVPALFDAENMRGRSHAMRDVSRAHARVKDDGKSRGATTRARASFARFEFATAARVVFGRGAFADVPQIVRECATNDDVDFSRQTVLIVCGARDELAKELQQRLTAEHGASSRTFRCPAGEPTVESAKACVEFAKREKCAIVVAIGGGTVVDTAKCVAAMLTNGGEEADVYEFLEVVGRARALKKRTAPFIAIPTTAGPGAEVAKNSVLEAGDRKVSMRHPFMLPSVAVIDPLLTLTLPRDVTAHTGLDALTQCIEPYVCCAPNPLVDAISMAGIVAGSSALRRVVDDGADIDAREQMCLCSLYGGMSLANAKLGAVHGFSGTLGGLLHAPHGAICAALLPHSWTVNIAALEGRVAKSDPELSKRALERYAAVARAMTGDPAASARDGIAFLVDLVAHCGVPSLGSFGLEHADFKSVIEKSKQSSSMKGNPVALDDAELAEMLRLAT